ncbi:MAG: hypothetical protein CMH83_14805 [Nocardioides sp.]|nr:hypothetical protein [Nocardioides sp.]
MSAGVRAARAARFARHAVVLEVALYACLVRWVARRPHVAAGTEPIGYARLVGPMLWLWILASAAEVLVVEVVLRSIDAGWAHALRLPLLVLGVWGVVWMLGMLASYRVRPHLLGADVLLARNGALTVVEVPRHALRRARPVERDLPSTIRALHHEGDVLLVGVSGRTNLDLVLDGPTEIRTPRGTVVVGTVALWVDDPRDVATGW